MTVTENTKDSTTFNGDVHLEPFGETAEEYASKGWLPLPLPYGDKFPPPTGFTGYKSSDPTAEDIAGWITEPARNIALKLPKDMIAIDVDNYNGKAGRATLEALETRLGPLPTTVVATARPLADGGKYFYRVPNGTQFKAELGAGIEVLQNHHRYAVVAPSLHATAGLVRWVYSADGEELEEIPEPDDAPDLPWAWITEFQSTPKELEHTPTVTSSEVRAWLESTTDNQQPQWLNRITDGFTRSCAAKECRHDSMLHAWVMAAREAEAGAYPAALANEKLKQLWEQAVQDPKRDHEYQDFIAAAVSYLPSEGSQQWVQTNKQKLAQLAATETTTTTVVASAGVGELTARVDDTSMGEALANELTGKYLFVNSWNQWLYWDGKRWAEDDVKGINNLAKEWVKKFCHELLERNADSNILNKVATFRNVHKLKAIVELASSEHGIAARAADFDRHRDLLNCQNGVVNLRTGELTEHDPKLMFRKITGANYYPEATHPDSTKMLTAVAEEAQPWLQRFFGYAATGHVSEDVIAVLDGGGSNGKTTLLNGVSNALGDYAAPAATQLIMAGNNEHPTLKADLQGKRLVTISETKQGGSLDMESLKGLTGGEAIKARFMHRDFFEFPPTHTLVLATNHRPYVNASEFAAWRRLRLVPFPNTYGNPDLATSKPSDTKLRERVMEGREQLEATLAWVIAGAVHWHRDGLGTSITISQATKEWQNSEDAIHRFIEDCLTLGQSGSVRGSVLYDTYNRWCKEEGRPTKSNKNFSQDFDTHPEIKAAGITRTKPGNVSTYNSIQLQFGWASQDRMPNDYYNNKRTPIEEFDQPTQTAIPELEEEQQYLDEAIEAMSQQELDEYLFDSALGDSS